MNANALQVQIFFLFVSFFFFLVWLIFNNSRAESNKINRDWHLSIGNVDSKKLFDQGNWINEQCESDSSMHRRKQQKRKSKHFCLVEICLIFFFFCLIFFNSLSFVRILIWISDIHMESSRISTWFCFSWSFQSNFDFEFSRKIQTKSLGGVHPSWRDCLEHLFIEFRKGSVQSIFEWAI